MSTVVEIDKALQTFPVEDARKVAGWLQHYLDEAWDKQIDGDIAAGRLDKLWEKARTDIAAGRLKPLNEIINDQCLPKSRDNSLTSKNSHRRDFLRAFNSPGRCFVFQPPDQAFKYQPSIVGA
jgi:hypothetical protein